MLETYQCHMSLKNMYLHKYLFITYLYNLKKKIKEDQKTKIWVKMQIPQIKVNDQGASQVYKYLHFFFIFSISFL